MKNIYYNRNLVVKAAIILLIFFASCKKEAKYKDVVLITGAESTNILNFPVDGTPSSIALTASATTVVNQDIDIRFTVDTALLKFYNTTNQTNFYSLPAGSYQLSTNDAVIKSGGNVSSPVKLTVTSTAKLVTGRNYMVPVSINVTKGNLNVLKSSGTAFVKINQVITTSVADVTNAVTVLKNFPNVISLSNFTFEFRVKVSQFASTFHISTIGAIGDTVKSSSTFNLFRFGELSDDINQLQWINTAGKVSSKTRFASDTWYNVSCVFDGNTCTMYINGIADGSFSAAGQSFKFNSLLLFSSGQALAGQICEIRLWSKALSPGEMQNGFCGVDPASVGLIAYWKFNEGKGNDITDYSGHGYSFAAQADYNWVSGVKCPN